MNIPSPAEQFARARELKLKFWPANPPPIVRRVKNTKTVEVVRSTFEQCRTALPLTVRAVANPGRTYGPFPLPRDFLDISFAAFDRALDAVRNGPSPKRIIAETAEEFGVTVEAVLGPRRDAKVMVARQTAMARVYEQCPGLSLIQMGRLFNRDHTTVLYAVKKFGVWRGQQ